MAGKRDKRKRQEKRDALGRQDRAGNPYDDPLTEPSFIPLDSDGTDRIGDSTPSEDDRRSSSNDHSRSADDHAPSPGDDYYAPHDDYSIPPTYDQMPSPYDHAPAEAEVDKTSDAATREAMPESRRTTIAGTRTDGEPLIRIQKLCVQFDNHRVLRNLSLDIPRGQMLAILGESGCGKTVLLKTIIGLIKPTSGRIIFDGKDLGELTERELTRQRIRFGFVFQHAALFDSMTIEQNISFSLREHTKKKNDEIASIVGVRLAEVGLPESVLGKKPAQLSGGMRKRVGLARALVMEPEIMLYDEPTTGLDPIMSDIINELLLSTQRLHPVTSIMVTHDMPSAKKVADRVVMLYPLSRLEPNEPQILYDGPPEEIESCGDRRVTQFVRGEAGERLMEMRSQ